MTQCAKIIELWIHGKCCNSVFKLRLKCWEVGRIYS